MKGPWSSMTILMAAAAAGSACVAVAAPVEAGASVATYTSDGASVPSLLLTAAIGNSGDVLAPLRAWIDDSYDHAPALMLGLSVLLLVPVLALAGFVVRRSRPQMSPDATVLLTRRRNKEASKNTDTDLSPPTRTINAAQPAQSWVETDTGQRVVIGYGMVRIGREADNDIRFADKTVHRYHAIIRRTTDGEVMITDMSGDDGNGVTVNGARITEARLSRGDVINIGKIKLRFDAQVA